MHYEPKNIVLALMVDTKVFPKEAYFWFNYISRASLQT